MCVRERAAVIKEKYQGDCSEGEAEADGKTEAGSEQQQTMKCPDDEERR